MAISHRTIALGRILNRTLLIAYGLRIAQAGIEGVSLAELAPYIGAWLSWVILYEGTKNGPRLFARVR